MLDKLKISFFLALSIAASVGGVLVSIFWTHNKDDGGRGGAVGTCIALAFMFLNHGYGSKLYEVVSKDIPELEEWVKQLNESKAPQADQQTPQASQTEPLDLSELTVRVNALGTASFIDGDEQKWQNRFLAGATAIGTLLWGFGDLIAAHFIKAAPGH